MDAISELEALQVILGHSGRLVSQSKSCGPTMAIFNANVVIGDQVVWYGDVDLDISEGPLTRLSYKVSKPIEVYYESALRRFNFETDPEKYSKQEQKDRTEQTALIQNKHGLAWTTEAPRLFRPEFLGRKTEKDPLGHEFSYNEFKGTDYYQAQAEREVIKEDNIRERRALAGSLTPVGTEWRWYNKWFYKGPYRVYRRIADWVYLYIGSPFRSAFIWGCKDWVGRTKDGGLLYERVPFYIQSANFFRTIVREIGYQHGIFTENTWGRPERRYLPRSIIKQIDKLKNITNLNKNRG